MKHLLLLLTFLSFAFIAPINAQEDSTEAAITEESVNETASEATAAVEEETTPAVVDEDANKSFHQVLKNNFIDGDWRFMSFVLACLILGLAFAIERIITLNLASTNVDKLLDKVNDYVKDGDISGAMELCKKTPGPAAAVLHEGLKDSDKGLEAVEKSITAYGSVQMNLLEKGLVWIALFIAIAPMLGFMGTVIGMIQAFESIAAAGTLDIGLIADSIKLALLTTVFGLIVAIILQIFYNYIVSKVDDLTGKMEVASIGLVDILADNKVIQ